MKSTTNVTIGVRNVGDATDRPAFFTGQFHESLKQLILWLGKKSMNLRFDVVIARNPEEAEKSLEIRGRGPGKAGEKAGAEMLQTLEQLFADAGMETDDAS